MKKTFVISVLAVAALSAIAQTRPAPQQTGTVAIQTARTAPTDVARIRADNRFQAALQIIEENGESVDLAAPSTVSARQAAGGPREIVFNITGSGGQPPEFSRLVYLERPGGPPLVYFDGPTVTMEPPATKGAPTSPATPLAKLCLFKPWGPWQVLRTYCAFRFWCFLKGQQAIYLDETRQRQCPSGVQVETRTVVVHCGC